MKIKLFTLMAMTLSVTQLFAADLTNLQNDINESFKKAAQAREQEIYKAISAIEQDTQLSEQINHVKKQLNLVV